MEPVLTTDGQAALDTILSWFNPFIQQRRREKICRVVSWLMLEKGVSEADRDTVIEAGKFVLQPSYIPRFKAMENQAPDRNAVKATYLSLESYYDAPRLVKRWDIDAGMPSKPAGEMKVLAICSSPRIGGNSETVVDAALRGAAQAGASVEKLHLSQLPIKPCDNTLIMRDYQVAREKLPEFGIEYCRHHCPAGQEGGEASCSLDDKMAEIYQRIADADAVIVAFPIINGWECSLLSGFLERWDRYDACIKGGMAPGTRGMVINTWGFLDTGTYEHIMENIIHRLHFRKIETVEALAVCGVVGMLSGLDKDCQGIIGKTPDELEKAFQAGRTLVTGRRD